MVHERKQRIQPFSIHCDFFQLHLAAPVHSALLRPVREAAKAPPFTKARPVQARHLAEVAQ